MNLTSFPRTSAYSISNSNNVSMWSEVKAIGTNMMCLRPFFTSPVIASDVCGPSQAAGPTLKTRKSLREMVSEEINLFLSMLFNEKMWTWKWNLPSEIAKKEFLKWLEWLQLSFASKKLREIQSGLSAKLEAGQVDKINPEIERTK